MDARDVGKMVISSFLKGKIGESYILSENFYSMKKIYEMCHEITGLSVPKFEIPLAFAYLGIPFDKLKAILLSREPLVTSEALGALKTMAELDNKKAVNELGFKPRKMEETLRDIYIWFIKNDFINLKDERGLTKKKCESLIVKEKEVYLKAG